MFHHGLERVRGVDAMIIMTSAVMLWGDEGRRDGRLTEFALVVVGVCLSFAYQSTDVAGSY